MRIQEIRTWREAVPLTRPYTIAFATRTDVDLFFVELVTDDGRRGLGSASPAPDITGEDVASCASALERDHLGWLHGEDPRHLGRLARLAEGFMKATPAARAAVDMALHDLFGHAVEAPLVDILGRCHGRLPTSITIGIKSTEEALAEAEEYLGRGFRNLKIKVGHDLEEDRERLTRLREAVGPHVAIRIDGNQGFDREAALALLPLARQLDLELVEQPLPADDVDGMRGLPAELRDLVAADESLHDETDAMALASPPACGIYNIKLMKCGGPFAARGIGRIAEAAGIDLMWGCMDESVISIAAALHTALASPATRYLDLDGSFDLARDPAVGGFVLEDGFLRPTDAPGLGVRLADEGQP